jgi:hypothetical protein
MFTFIRLAAIQVLGGSVRKVQTEQKDDVTQDYDIEIEGDQLHPWQRELDRLAHDGGATTTKRRPTGSYLPKSQPARKPIPKAGTIADLKVWWGKATTTYRPPKVDVQDFTPQVERKRNRWYP